MKEFLNTLARAILFCLVAFTLKSLGLRVGIDASQMYNLGVLVSFVMILILTEASKLLHYLIVTFRLVFCSEETLKEILAELGYKINITSKEMNGDEDNN